MPLDAIAQGIDGRREKSPYTVALVIADVKSLCDQGMSKSEAAAKLGVKDMESLNQLLELHEMQS